ncbi:MAG: hypothetical protein JSV03_07355, partial [Planctomycetota bacterium]
MTQSMRWLSSITSLAVMLGLTANLRAQQTRSASDEISKLLSKLKQNRVYLFDTQARSGFDEIDNQIREAISGENKATDEKTKTEHVTRRKAAEKELIELLKKQHKLIEFSLKGNQAIALGNSRLVLPGDTGIALLRIGNKDETIKFIEKSYDLSQSRDRIAVDIKPKGITWVALDLANVPDGTSSLMMDLKKPNGQSLILIVDVIAPEPAKLRVSILSAEAGKVVPAMIKLVWKLDGKERRPSNVVDFESQFDNLGRADCQRHAKLPGRLGGHLWWCVPGPFDMPIPPGGWEIIIRRGVEHIPIFDSFVAKPGQAIEKTYTPRHWADMPKLGWYSGDDHVHCRIASDKDARRLMSWAQAEDVHVVNVMAMGDVYRTWFQQRGFGPAHRVTDGDYVLVPGQECPRTHSAGFGHTLSINTTSWVRDVNKYWLYDWVADTVHAQGGLFGYAHALLTHPYIRRGMSLSAYRHKVDFAEILQYGEMGTD